MSGEKNGLAKWQVALAVGAGATALVGASLLAYVVYRRRRETVQRPRSPGKGERDPAEVTAGVDGGNHVVKDTEQKSKVSLFIPKGCGVFHGEGRDFLPASLLEKIEVNLRCSTKSPTPTTYVSAPNHHRGDALSAELVLALTALRWFSSQPNPIPSFSVSRLVDNCVDHRC